MAQISPILTADRGRASATAWGVLCLLAVVQGALIIRAVWQSREAAPAAPRQPPAASAPAAALMPPALAASAVAPVPSPAPPAASPFSVAPSTTAPPPIGSFEKPGNPVPVPTPAPVPTPPLMQPPAVVPRPAAPVPPAAAPSPARPAERQDAFGKILPDRAPAPDQKLPLTGAVGDMSVEEMVELAKQVRGLDDMQGALEVLKRADLQYPDHPAVLEETAICYEKMGLADKAAAAWKRLETMSPEKAGAYRALAQRRLDAPADVVSTRTANADVSSKVLRLGACQAVRDAAAAQGEKVVLRIPIQRTGLGAIDPRQVDVDVFFFDRVNGERIAQTIADDPVSTWSSAPVDWSGPGEEPLDVVYFMPALSPAEIQNHGRRSYHGYLVKLYYQQKLQDVAAEPRDLLDYGSGVPQSAGAGNPLLPPVTN